MINVSDVATGLLGLGVIAAAVGLVAVGGRDRTADQHDLTDYRPDPDAVRAVMCGIEVEDVRRRLVDILPPTPAGADAGSPLYVETLFRTWYPDAPDVVAGRMLREIAEESDDVIWNRDGSEHYARFDGSCWPDCPGCARDLTGAFPLVRAA